MKPHLVFSWQWSNRPEVITRFHRDEGLGAALAHFVRAGWNVTLTTICEQGFFDGIIDGLHYRVFPDQTNLDDWASYVADLEPDVVLGWGSMDHQIGPAIRKLLPHVPLLYCLAGGPADHPLYQIYDHFFVETDFHVQDLNRLGKLATLAQGVLTDVLTPVTQPKQWDVCFPQAFTSNKRLDLFCDTIRTGGFSAVTPGPVNDRDLWNLCKQTGIMTLGYLAREALRDVYCASRVTVVTGGIHGGSQRTVLESLACGIPVIACDDNHQLDSFRRMNAPVTFVPPNVAFLRDAIQETVRNPVDGARLRQWVLDHWTDRHYFEAIQHVIRTRTTCPVS